MPPSEEDLLELTDMWHEGKWPEATLEEVIRDATSWTRKQFDAWVAYGEPHPTLPWREYILSLIPADE